MAKTHAEAARMRPINLVVYIMRGFGERSWDAEVTV